MVFGCLVRPVTWRPWCRDFDSKVANPILTKVGDLGDLRTSLEIRLARFARFPYLPRRLSRGEPMRHYRLPVVAAVVAVLAAPGLALAQPPIAFEDAGIHAIQFIDQSEGWAVGDDGVIWHSIDGGKTWERQKTGTRA